MKVANLSEVKDQLSKYVEMARRGARIQILVRGVPAAELVAPSGGDGGSDGEWPVEELGRRGVVRRGTGKLPPEIRRAGPKPKRGTLSKAVLDERREGP